MLWRLLCSAPQREAPPPLEWAVPAFSEAAHLPLAPGEGVGCLYVDGGKPFQRPLFTENVPETIILFAHLLLQCKTNHKIIGFNLKCVPCVFANLTGASKLFSNFIYFCFLFLYVH